MPVQMEEGNGWRQGRGRGRRRGRGRVRRFLQPCLLLLLHQGDAHGYSLLSDLERFGFDPQFFDPSLAYRALHEMEEAGWVNSAWGEESQGPRRRVYSITEAGEAHLDAWVADLRRAQSEIGRLIKAYEEHTRAHHAEENPQSEESLETEEKRET
jgi:PadR family transcriptional regulator PadR